MPDGVVPLFFFFKVLRTDYIQCELDLKLVKYCNAFHC
jgi:hypothetical protein